MRKLLSENIYCSTHWDKSLWRFSNRLKYRDLKTFFYCAVKNLTNIFIVSQTIAADCESEGCIFLKNIFFFFYIGFVQR